MRVELWTAFSPSPGGGSPAGVVHHGADLETGEMQRIATEVGAPATGFVTETSADEVTVRFFSPRTEYGMCGHGTIAVLTALFEAGALGRGSVRLRTGSDDGTAHLEPRDDGRLDVLLDLAVAMIEPAPDDLRAVWTALGTTPSPCALSRSDFTHLLCPMSLDTVMGLQPDFAALDLACRSAGIDTVGVYSTGTVSPEAQVHTRDFCPAVGTPEAAATGTTNRAIVSHLVAADPSCFPAGHHTLVIEQGIEMERPSQVRVVFTTGHGGLESISVGGVATRLESRSV